MADRARVEGVVGAKRQYRRPPEERAVELVVAVGLVVAAAMAVARVSRSYALRVP
jgi:hypothetical protein